MNMESDMTNATYGIDVFDAFRVGMSLPS
jgi:hypothetical protein